MTDTPTPAELARLATALDTLPARMRQLPIDDAGRPVPYFVYVHPDGKPDHRVVDAAKWRPAIKGRLCWICGQGLGRFLSFAIGPMCTVNRVSGEWAQHTDCATWAAMHCPFLVNPNRERREANLPDGVTFSDVGLKRNPTAMCVYTTTVASPFLAAGTPLVSMGAPHSVAWYRYGREATRQEVLDAIHSGKTALADVADQDGPQARARFDQQLQWVLDNLLPEE